MHWEGRCVFFFFIALFQLKIKTKQKQKNYEKRHWEKQWNPLKEFYCLYLFSFEFNHTIILEKSKTMQMNVVPILLLKDLFPLSVWWPTFPVPCSHSFLLCGLRHEGNSYKFRVRRNLKSQEAWIATVQLGRPHENAVVILSGVWWTFGTALYKILWYDHLPTFTPFTIGS